MSSPISFSGLVSGLDTSSLINALLAVDRQPISQLQQRSAILTVEQAAINQLKIDATSLQQAVQALTLASNVNAKQVTTDTPAGQPAILTATAGADAASGSYTVLVKQIATATMVTSASPGGSTVAAIGNAVNLTAPITSAGIGTPVTTGTFTINGRTITIDSSSKLYDPSDPAHSIVNLINSSGAGVTASIVNDAYGRPNILQLVSAPGVAIQLGSSNDTSNFLSAVGLLGGAIVGNTATSVTGSSVGAGAISATITIDGKSVVINQTNSTYSTAQNAAYIANALNQAGLDVTASVTGASNDQLQLTQKTLGSQGTITINVSGTNAAAVGLTNGTYQNGTDRVASPSPLGRIDPTQSLSTQSFVTPLAPNTSGGGTIQINGVQITWSSGDSLNNVISRINASSAGVRASYDALTDRLTLTATATGGAAISLQDVSGNLLQSLHLLNSTGQSVPQQLGQNAIVNISGVNNGQDISTSSNTLSNYIPGLTLTLQRASTTPVTLTVSQDTTTTLNTVHSFVTALNTFLGDVDKYTLSDPNPSKAGPLAGDYGVQGIEQTLRTLMTTPVSGGTPGYQTLTSVGISSGPIGSAPGTTSTYQVDDAKLTAALQSNPTAVRTLFAALTANLGAVTQTSGSGNAVTGASGTPTDSHLNGTYVVTVLDTAGNAQVQFNASNGQVLFSRTGVLSPNSTNTTLIPGISLATGGTIQPATFKFSVSWTEGVANSLNDYLNSLIAPGGFFDARTRAITSEQQDITNNVNSLQQMLTVRQQALAQQFARLEATLALLQSQGNALGMQILGMGGGGGASPSSGLGGLPSTSKGV